MKVNINHKTHLCSPLQKNPDRDFKQESIIQINTRHVLCLLNIGFKDIWQSRFYMYSMIWCTLVFFMFVCLGFFVQLENFSLMWRRHHCRWRAAHFDLCSILMANEQWRFFSVPHLLWHGVSVYNDLFRGPVTLTPNTERSAAELSLPVLTIRTHNLPLAGRYLWLVIL